MGRHDSERRTSIWMALLILLLPLGHFAQQPAAMQPDTNGTDTDIAAASDPDADQAQVVVMSGAISNATSHAGLAEDTNEEEDSGGVSPSRQSVPDLDDHLKKGGPCEAGHKCRADEWCSPSRSVCRPCGDIQPWCNDTDLILDKYPECERFCFEILLDAVRESYEAQLKAARQQVLEKDQTIVNLTEALRRQKETCQRVTAQLEKQCKIQEGNTTIIAGLACAFTLSVLWAIVVSALLWCQHLQHQRRHKIGTQDPEALEAVPRSTDQVNAPLLPTEEAKAPVQAHTMDSGVYCGNSSLPGARVTGDAAVAPC